MFIMLISTKECDKNKVQLASENSSEVTLEKNELITQNEILSGTYRLAVLENEMITEELTIAFDETTNKVSGFSRCNQYFGTYKTDGNSIVFSQIGSTKKYCQSEANKIEQKFLKALSKVNMFSLQENNLSLHVDKETLIQANQNKSSRTMQDNMTINYQAATRGFYLQIWIEGDSIKYTSDYNLKAISTHVIPLEEKESLMSLINDLDEKLLLEIEAPSRQFQFDGAPLATFEISNSEGVYKTVSFDHGNSPKLISAIVEKILSIKTMFEKQ